VQLQRQFARCFRDYQNPKKIDHTVAELIGRRVYGTALQEHAKSIILRSPTLDFTSFGSLVRYLGHMRASLELHRRILCSWNCGSNRPGAAREHFLLLAHGLRARGGYRSGRLEPAPRAGSDRPPPLASRGASSSNFLFAFT
jgi:hypothetical protein